MKIVITGGAGYIGSALTVSLAKQEAVTEIMVYDILSRGDYGLFTQKNLSKKVKFVKANILDQHSLSNTLEGCDIVFHLAAKVTTPDSDNDSQYFEQVNNWGTANVINEVKKAGVKHFIYLSSVYVYGQGPEVKTTDDTPLPNSFYGISKLRGEEHIMSLPASTKHHIIRSGSVYGQSPATRYDVLINQFFFQAHYFKKITVNGEGHQIRPFIHIDKLVKSLCELPNSTLSNGIYNLVEHNVSVNDILEQLLQKYPDLEYNNVNRHIKMKDIIVESSKEMQEYIPWQEKSFAKEMEEFLSTFW